ncbi:hypothetical protein D9M68_993270 [compost metagenome]
MAVHIEGVVRSKTNDLIGVLPFVSGGGRPDGFHFHFPFGRHLAEMLLHGSRIGCLIKEGGFDSGPDTERGFFFQDALCFYRRYGFFPAFFAGKEEEEENG